MIPIRFLVIALTLACCAAASAFDLDQPWFSSTDPLAARDEWGLLTQGPLNPTDFERRHSRMFYYLQSGRALVSDPAYVGAVQVCLRRKGYCFGPVDGIFSDGS